MKFEVIVLFICLVFSTSVHAKFYFGKDESINFIMDVKLEGAKGENLQLSRIVIRESFLLPYHVKDGGFILTIKGNHDSYFDFPKDKKLVELQNKGLLPKPLPEWKLSTLDIIIGYALWEALGLMFVWNLIKKVFRRT